MENTNLSAFCPMPHYYGSMRIDTVSSVQHLGDPIAEEEARLLQTQRYLVYLHYVRMIMCVSGFNIDRCLNAPGACTSVPRYALVLLHGRSHRSGVSSLRARESNNSGHVYSTISLRRSPYRTSSSLYQAPISVLELLSLDTVSGLRCSHSRKTWRRGIRRYPRDRAPGQAAHIPGEILARRSGSCGCEIEESQEESGMYCRSSISGLRVECLIRQVARGSKDRTSWWRNRCCACTRCRRLRLFFTVIQPAFHEWRGFRRVEIGGFC